MLVALLHPWTMMCFGIQEVSFRGCHSTLPGSKRSLGNAGGVAPCKTTVLVLGENSGHTVTPAAGSLKGLAILSGEGLRPRFRLYSPGELAARGKSKRRCGISVRLGDSLER